MTTFFHLTRITVGLGTVGGLYAYYSSDKIKRNKVYAFTDNSYNGITAKWDFNWDKRDPESNVVKSSKSGSGGNDDVCVKPKAVRHIILIRHGQYNLAGNNDKERTLTPLGREQAAFAGKRLNELDFPYTNLIHSTMTRAIETAKIIKEFLPGVPVTECLLLEEGAPIAPEPPVGHWKPPHYFHQDGARIEAAFRKYFYRADGQQEKDSFDIIVCHANVIRYFVCRALQYPPEGWLRLSLKHASITWLSILPSGRVLLRCYGDAGYMPPYALTTS